MSSADGKIVRMFQFPQPVRSLAFAPDGARLLIAAADAEAGNLWRWDTLARDADLQPLLDKEPPADKPPPVWAMFPEKVLRVTVAGLRVCTAPPRWVPLLTSTVFPVKVQFLMVRGPPVVARIAPPEP